MTTQEFHKTIFSRLQTVSTDSRNISKDCLFFALKGENFNGNTFALEAIKQGAAYSIVDDPSLQNEPNCIYVDDVLTFLQDLANYHRKQCNAKIIGITGTNGKTTTKELISAVLSKKFKIIYTLGNLNNHIGVPLTLLRIKADTEIAIIEMGANHQKEIGFLSNIAEPNYGIITNIGKAHIEGFGSFENIIKTKTELYDFISKTNGVIFQDIDNTILVENSKHITSKETYSLENKGTYNGETLSNRIFASFSFTHKTTTTTITSRLFGEYNIKNMLAAASIGTYFNVPAELIKEALESYNPSNNRSQLQKTATNTLILDYYNANPTSMKAALTEFAKLPEKNIGLILGEMYELGKTSKEEHTNIQNFVSTIPVTFVYYVGNWDKSKKVKNASFFSNSQELKTYLQNNTIANQTILIKGSRGVKLETIVDCL